MSDNSFEEALQSNLSFSEYMELALYHPKWGYYMQNPSPIKRDFVTAPLLSPLLTEAINQWISMQEYKDVLEIGAGTGHLAKQLLKNPDIQSYSILDKNPIASKHINDPRCQWIDAVEDFEGIIIANEVLDALPFRRFCLQDEGLYEFVIRGSRVELDKANMADLPPSIQSKLAGLPKPYIFEYCDYSMLFKQLRSFKGTSLWIDYGYFEDYFHPDRALGTMMCYQNHHSIPFTVAQTGKMDITAAVNWPLAIEMASASGFQLGKYGSQKDFIMMMGISENSLNKSAMRVLCEHEMGLFVKVVELSKPK